MLVAHTFNPSTGRQWQVDLSEFEASLVYRVSSRTARMTEKPCLKKTKMSIKGKKDQCSVCAHTRSHGHVLVYLCV